MKRIIPTLLVAGLLLTNNADAWVEGYIGGTVGVGIPDILYNPIPINAPSERWFTKLGSGVGFIGGAVAGVEAVWNTCCFGPIYFAFEGNARYNTYDKKIADFYEPSGSLLRVHVKNEFLYGGDFKIGTPIDFCKTDVYGLAGVQAGKWTTKLVNSTDINQFGVPAFSRVSYGEVRVAPKVGFGVRVRLPCCLTADLQYSYSWFIKRDKIVIYNLEDPLEIEWHHKTRVNQNQILLTISFPLYVITGSWY